jgi:tRNA A-37 threonylcarbamoyl transferase component Bud32
MAFVEINPRYRTLLQRLDLRFPTDFYRLEGIFVGGHAERDIARVTVGEGPPRLTGYLKREHRVRWRDRLRSALSGFGLVSRCCREGKLLERLAREHIGCPEVIAMGEDDNGRSFLLVRELSDARELRRIMSEAPPAHDERRPFARRLGRALARIHRAGFFHRDLYSKHVLVCTGETGGSEEFVFIDWQRSRQRPRLAWSRCWQDLAALDATLADELAGPKDRLACLAAYCRCWKATNTATVPPLVEAARTIRRRALRLQRRQRSAEMRQPPLESQQSCIKLDGEGVLLTRQFREELRGELPSWLRLGPQGPQPFSSVMRVELPIAPPRPGRLVRRRVNRPLWRLWSLLGGKAFVSPEVRRAGTLVRLERYGIRTPRLLAFGQRSDRWGHTEALLLTEELSATTPLAAWLETTPPAARASRRRLLHEAGAVMRRMHAAACFFDGNTRSLASVLCVEALADGSERVVLANPAAVRRQNRLSERRAAQDLAILLGTFDVVCSRTEVLHFLLTYLDLPQLNNEARRFIRRIRRFQPRVPHAIPWRLGT